MKSRLDAYQTLGEIREYLHIERVRPRGTNGPMKENLAPEIDFSIVICSCNRAESLKSTLEGLKEMTTPQGTTWEVVVVDNNSHDCTREVTDVFAANNPGMVKYVFEKRQGKSFALNAGIGNARGRIIAFTDDDCFVDRQWMSAILDEYTSDPELAVLGGRVELHNQDDKPFSLVQWPEKTAFQSLELLFEPLIIGCNMVAKREVFAVAGGFDPALGPGSKTGAIAEDVDFIYRAHKAGFKVIYSPNVLVYHNHGRQTEEEIKVLMRKYGMGRGSFYCKYILRWHADVIKLACEEIKNTVTNILLGSLRGEPTDRRRQALRDLLKGAASRITYLASVRSREKKDS